MVRQRFPFIKLVSNADGKAGARKQVLADGARPVRCPKCTELLGVEIIARITMLPTMARRDMQGRISLDEQVLVCSACLKRGVETRF